ncbi:MAG: metal-sensitive transcriptional regulator [Chloroflexota bacterium]
MNARHKRDALLRLKTVRGHIDGVIGMVEQEVYCPDLMKQVSALQASLERVNRILLENHLETCVTEAIQAGGGDEKIQELIEALRFNSSLTTFREVEPAEFGPVGPTSPAASAGPSRIGALREGKGEGSPPVPTKLSPRLAARGERQPDGAAVQGHGPAAKRTRPATPAKGI